MKKYYPQKGDFVTLNFDPQSGHEQKGRRPAIVVSNSLFNEKTGLAFVCPITNTDRKYPFHIKIPQENKITGFIMTEQVKSVDYAARKVKYIQKAAEEIIDEVLAILDVCLY
jgi:mRNA interferase MazF